MAHRHPLSRLGLLAPTLPVLRRRAERALYQTGPPVRLWPLPAHVFPDGLFPFFPALWRRRHGRPWAHASSGRDGFVESPFLQTHFRLARVPPCRQARDARPFEAEFRGSHRGGRRRHLLGTDQARGEGLPEEEERVRQGGDPGRERWVFFIFFILFFIF